MLPHAVSRHCGFILYAGKAEGTRAMPHLHIKLPNSETHAEWEELDYDHLQAADQKRPRRPQNFRSEAHEQRLFERRKYHDRTKIAALV